MNASVKLLLIVREPVTRAISDYTQLRSHAATASPSPPSERAAPPWAGPQAVGPQGARSFEELAIKPDGTVNLAYRPLSTSLYSSFLHRWLDVFSRDQLLVVNGDLLIEDPVPELRRIEQFLGGLSQCVNIGLEIPSPLACSQRALLEFVSNATPATLESSGSHAAAMPPRIRRGEGRGGSFRSLHSLP